MDYCIVILTSVTAAKRAQKILERKGVSSLIIRTPSEISSSGCSNSLKIKSNQIKDATNTLDEADFNIRGIYGKTCYENKCEYVKINV